MSLSDVLDPPAGARTEQRGLGLVSTLLDLPTDNTAAGPRARDREDVQRGGRQWFGGQVSPAVVTSSQTSQRIQQSLSRLNEVLSPPICLPIEATPTNIHANTPPRLGLSGIASRQGETSFMDNTIMRDLCLAPTPAHNTTHMPPPGQSRLHSTQLLEETILGEDSTVAEDPSQKVGGDLIMAFHRELSAHSQPSQSLEMATALEKCCEVQWNILTEFEKQTRVSVDQLQSELRMEIATWQLLYVLSRDRVEEGRVSDVMETLEREGTSDKEVADLLFTQDSTVRQAQLVVDWLEGLARVGLEQYPVKTAYFTDNVCWENTLHDLTHGIDCDVLVTEMDPDAPTRQQQRKLSELDIKDELSLNKHLFTCLRAGQLDKALELCVHSGQSLKALMLEGWKLHHDPNTDMQYSDELRQVEGNEFRDLWKATCWQMLSEVIYDVYETAMFAALSGNVEKLLPACQTWYDHVWAYFKTLVDVQVEKALHSRSGRQLMELPSEYWSNVLLPQQIFQEIEASPSADVRQQAQSHFHLIQKYIILDDMNGLVEEMIGWLPAQPSLHRLRLMAHIGLVVRGLGGVREERKIDALLEAYVKALTEGHYQTAVALYAAQLPVDSQVTSYAHLLAGVHNEEQQKHCLKLGKEAGVDIALVTRAVVESIRDSGLDECRDTVELGQDVQLTQLDQSKIRAMNWLVYEETQRPEAIRQGNVLIRQFLTARKYSAARAVFQKIPPDSPQLITRLWQQKAGASPLPLHVASDLTELLALQTYLEAKEAFNVWFQHFHHLKPAMPQEPTEGAFREKVAFEHRFAQYELECEQWRLEANLLTEEASRRLNDVLVFSGGWMRGHTEDETMSQQLQALRQTCIPEVCFLLHSVLHSAGLNQKCLQISDVIASDEYMLYKDFRDDELRQLLMLLQRSALDLTTDPATDELGYPVT